MKHWAKHSPANRRCASPLDPKLQQQLPKVHRLATGHALLRSFGLSFPELQQAWTRPTAAAGDCQPFKLPRCHEGGSALSATALARQWPSHHNLILCHSRKVVALFGNSVHRDIQVVRSLVNAFGSRDSLEKWLEFLDFAAGANYVRIVSPVPANRYELCNLKRRRFGAVRLKQKHRRQTQHASQQD